MNLKIKDVTDACGISVASVRNYETYGLIPSPSRGTNNYRVYTKRHVNHLHCVLSMRAGFSRPEILEIMQNLREGDVNQVLLLCASKQRNLMNALDQANQTMAYLNNTDINVSLRLPKPVSIQKASELTGVSVTTLRHWEHEGLLNPHRNRNNNYRSYDQSLISRIMIIKIIRSAVWSLEEVRKTLLQFEDKDPKTVLSITLDAIQYLHRLNIHQHQGIHAVYTLLLQEGLVDEQYHHDYTFKFNVTL